MRIRVNFNYKGEPLNVLTTTWIEIMMTSRMPICLQMEDYLNMVVLKSIY